MKARTFANRQPGWLVLILPILLAGCGSFQYRDGAPNTRVNVDNIPDPVPRKEPISRYGNPPTYTVLGKTYTTLTSSKGFVERGIASWYGTKFHGRRTSSGEPYNMYAMTAAHKTLPLPSYVEVTNLENGRRVIVKVNDRGPFHDGRIIDLSYTAAIKLGVDKKGTSPVEIRAIDPDNPNAHRLAGTAPATTTANTPAQTTSLRQNLYLQVGAFSSRANAENLRTRLQQIGSQPVNIFPGDNPDQPVYRVRIGPLSNAEVQQVVSQLHQQGINEAKVITD